MFSPGHAHRFNFVMNVLLVTGQLVRYIDQLVEDPPTDLACHTDRHDHHEQD